jgi:hypothetical protein
VRGGAESNDRKKHGLFYSGYTFLLFTYYHRDYRGVALLTVETEVKLNTNERGSFLVGAFGLSCKYKRFFSSVAALVGPIQNSFFHTVHYFNAYVPIAQQAGQAAELGRPLCVCVSGYYTFVQGSLPSTTVQNNLSIFSPSMKM